MIFVKGDRVQYIGGVILQREDFPVTYGDLGVVTIPNLDEQDNVTVLWDGSQLVCEMANLEHLLYIDSAF